MNRTSKEEFVDLGGSGVMVSRVGVGAWQWGDRFFWGYGDRYGKAEAREAFEAGIQAGVNFFDTAESYGSGRSESLVGEFLKPIADDVVVATKFFPYPWRLSEGNLLKALQNSLRRLQVESVGLYQIHWPFPPRSIDTWVRALGKAVRSGLTRAVGVSNFNQDQVRRAHRALAERGVPLASNQIQYSLLHRQPEANGIIEACQELGVAVIAYSPLAQGLLTGKYTPDNPPPGVRKRLRRREALTGIQSLLALIREIGEAHGGKSPSQVALNWLMRKGAIPIPGAKNARQAMDNCGALGWRITDDEMASLDAASSTIEM